jgi:hypothetical protein
VQCCSVDNELVHDEPWRPCVGGLRCRFRHLFDRLFRCKESDVQGSGCIPRNVRDRCIQPNLGERGCQPEYRTGLQIDVDLIGAEKRRVFRVAE